MPSLLTAIRAAFAEVRAAHPTERFYVFALFSETGDDLQPTCNTLEGLARCVKEKGSTEDELRFFAEEFAYHQHGEEHFQALGPTPAKNGLGPAVRALKALDKEGFFGEGAERAKIAVLVLRSDQNNREVVEIAQKLNPPAVAAQIASVFDVAKATGNPKTLGRDEAYSIDSLALSADGKTIAAAGWFGGSELFVYRLGKSPRALPVKRPREGFRGLAISPNGEALFGVTRDSVVRMPIANASPPMTIVLGANTSIALSPDGEVLATSSKKGVRLWSSNTLTELPARGKTTLDSFRFIPDGQAIVGMNAGNILVLDAIDLTTRSVIHMGDPRARAFSLTNEHVALGSYNPATPIEVLGLREERHLFDIAQHERAGVTALAFSRDGSRLASAGEDGHVRIWDMAKRKLLADVRGRQEAMNDVVFLNDGRVAAAGRDTSKGPPIYIWDVE